MRKVFALALVLYSPAAFAQDKPPPTVGGKPLVQVAPKTVAAKGAAPKAKPQSVAAKLQACLEIDDETDPQGGEVRGPSPATRWTATSITASPFPAA